MSSVKLTLAGAQLRVFLQSLGCFAKLCDQVSFEPAADHLAIRGIGHSKATHMLVGLGLSHFEQYEFKGARPSADGSGAACYFIDSKALQATVLKSCPSLVSLRAVFDGEHTPDTAELVMTTSIGVTRAFTLNLAAGVPERAVVQPHLYSFDAVADPRAWASFLSSFSSGTAKLTVVPSTTRLTLTVSDDFSGESAAPGAASSAASIEPRQFLSYRCSAATPLRTLHLGGRLSMQSPGAPPTAAAHEDPRPRPPSNDGAPEDSADLDLPVGKAIDFKPLKVFTYLCDLLGMRMRLLSGGRGLPVLLEAISRDPDAPVSHLSLLIAAFDLDPPLPTRGPAPGADTPNSADRRTSSSLVTPISSVHAPGGPRRPEADAVRGTSAASPARACSPAEEAAQRAAGATPHAAPSEDFIVVSSSAIANEDPPQHETLPPSAVAHPSNTVTRQHVCSSTPPVSSSATLRGPTAIVDGATIIASTQWSGAAARRPSVASSRLAGPSSIDITLSSTGKRRRSSAALRGGNDDDDDDDDGTGTRVPGTQYSQLSNQQQQHGGRSAPDDGLFVAATEERLPRQRARHEGGSPGSASPGAARALLGRDIHSAAPGRGAGGEERQEAAEGTPARELFAGGSERSRVHASADTGAHGSGSNLRRSAPSGVFTLDFDAVDDAAVDAFVYGLEMSVETAMMASGGGGGGGGGALHVPATGASEGRVVGSYENADDELADPAAAALIVARTQR